MWCALHAAGDQKNTVSGADRAKFSRLLFESGKELSMCTPIYNMSGNGQIELGTECCYSTRSFYVRNKFEEDPFLDDCTLFSQ